MPTALTLPNIDISPFLGERTPSSLLARQATAAQVHDACTRYGFFYLSGIESVVSQEEMDEALSVAREFFGRPEEEKAKLRIKKGDGARGWQMIGENVTQYKADWHEGWDAYKPLSPSEEDATKLLHGPNQWPTHPSSFRPVLERWVEKMHVLGYALTEATALALGIDVEGDSDEWRKMRAWVEDPFWVLRTIGYPPLPADAEGISCGAHKDYGYYTLLHADSTLGALQVFLRDSSSSSETGGTWINADPVPGVRRQHRRDGGGPFGGTVQGDAPSGPPSYRVSIPFFFEPSYDALIEPLPSALRLRSQLSSSSSTTEAPIKPVHYGTFLASKVAGNFALEKE
ncbi:putative 2-oxoglutarate-dependent dioxygenase [Rhodotorula toruloides]|nr:putative 2-oxoglutarate-dependent dioxygenase [Rhodotorula toruloides]